LKYYEIVLLRSSAPNLTYAFNEKVNVGSIVSVPLKSTLKDAVIVEEVHKPVFDTAQITSVSDRYDTSNRWTSPNL